MLIALPYCSTDREQAQKLCDWMAELDTYPNHTLLIFQEKQAQPLTIKAEFRKVETISFVDSFNRWPISTTNAFQTVARHIEYNQKQPFLFLEPDCVPLKKGWLDAIEAEYGRTKKPFMGAFVPGVGGSPDHCSGIAVYPGEVIKFAGQALMLDEDAPWDLTAADTIRPQAHFTDLIQHRWDRPAHPPFKTLEEFNGIVTKECVLFHADKSGSVINLLREGREVAEPALLQRSEKPSSSTTVPRKEDVAGSNPAPLTTLGSTTQEAPEKCNLQKFPKPASVLPSPLEGTRNNGMIFLNGAWRHILAPPVSSDEKQDGLQETKETISDLIPDAVAILKQLCRSPSHTGRVRKELKKQGVIR